MLHADGSFVPVLLVAFWAVLISELVGDKSIYALSSLALRYRWMVVLGAFALSSATKMLAATLIGSVAVRFQSQWTDVISAIAFFVSAILIWVDEPPEISAAETKKGGWARGVVVCFGAFFLSEWGDPGQIAAAALALRSHLLLATWLGATAALLVKGVVALTLGLQIRSRLPTRWLRVLSSGSCCVLGILAVAKGLIA